jgi:hypothetical protein
MTLDEIARAYLDGATAEQLAARLEASTRTVLRVLRERGVPVRRRGRPRSAKREHARALIAEGHDVRRVAEVTGLALDNVRSMIAYDDARAT